MASMRAIAAPIEATGASGAGKAIDMAVTIRSPRVHRLDATALPGRLPPQLTLASSPRSVSADLVANLIVKVTS
jgi:hypothetical protein